MGVGGSGKERGGCRTQPRAGWGAQLLLKPQGQQLISIPTLNHGAPVMGSKLHSDG